MREYKTVAFKCGNEEGLQPDQFSCYASTFGPPVDDVGEIIQQGAFSATLPDFLANGLVCWQHDWAEPVGKPLVAHEDGHGLYVKAQVSDTQRGREALTLMRDDVVRKMSIGYEVEGYRVLSDDEGRSLLGESAYDAALRDLPWWQAPQIKVLTQIKLYEVSIVSVPCNPRAAITGVKTDGPGGVPAFAGLTLAERCEALLCYERDYLGDLKDLGAMRAKEGRELSASNRAKITTIRQSLQTHITTLDDLLASSERASEAAGSTADGEGKTATDPALALAARAQLIRFQALEAHLHGAL